MSTENANASGKKHSAGAFDIRNFIGSLLAIFGVILLLMGLIGDPETDKTGGINANLWAGIVLLVVGAGFMLWARLRPVIVPEHVEKPEVDPTRPGPVGH